LNLRPTLGLGFDDVLLVPKKSVLASRKDANLVTLLSDELLLRIPILSANMPAVTEHRMARRMWALGGLGFIHRFMPIEDNVRQFSEATDYVSGGVRREAGVSLGIHEDHKRAQALYDAGARIFLVDVAHAHSDPVLRFVESLTNMFDGAQFIVGNVATAEAVRDLEDVGVSAVKVGIGPGAACSTRQVTGAGRAQLTAIAECASVSNVQIIADGGIRTSGDIVKALAAGASTVMLGRLLAGCDESPVPGSYWGNAAVRMNGHQAPEGAEGNVARTGTLEETLKPLLWGLRSGISYAGAKGVLDLSSVAEFEQVGAGVAAESAVRI
jgi:IMP dehydrogenase